MNINQSDLADALVLTTSDIKIICCDRCCVRDKMLRWKKKYCTRNATNLELVDKLVLTKSNKFWRGIYEVIHKKIVALYVALMKKCCKVERVCVGFKRVLGDWLVLGTTHQTHTYPLLHILQQYQRTFFKINMYALVDSFCNKCNKYINTRHLLMQHTHYCIQKLRRIEHNEYK